ncbi:MAG: pirin family protein [Pseudomonadota bacterium]|nr:pirin family protein [Pseudomonadota bacterium]
MSYYAAPPPECQEQRGRVQRLVEGRQRNLGGFCVRRVLPAAEQPMLGPFIFLDEMGPAELPAGEGINVRPHPHIGLATITYLFEGEILHRDSVGAVQPIRPGAVNLMTAGRGIAHSERAGSDLDRPARLHGLQCWMALPDSLEDCDPAFAHYTADDIPNVSRSGVDVRVVMGQAFGKRSPVETASPTLYCECRLDSGTTLACPAAVERGVYVVRGRLRIGRTVCEEGSLAVLDADDALELHAEVDTLCIILGGDPVGPRHIFWNFVARDPDAIEQAKADWMARRFPEIPDDHEEWIPIPEWPTTRGA